jgi:hypothetical protein
MTLSETFLTLLLDDFDRHLTLKDVISSFYKDPRFPLVPTLDEIRQVIFDFPGPTVILIASGALQAREQECGLATDQD